MKIKIFLLKLVPWTAVLMCFVFTWGFWLSKDRQWQGTFDDLSLTIESLKRQVPISAKYILLVKELDAASQGKLSAYQSAEVAREIVTQCYFHQDIGLTPDKIMAIMERESSFNPEAVSVAKAYGIMQVIESTWLIHADDLGYGRKFDRDLALDPIVNVKVGIQEVVRLRQYWLSEGVDSWLVVYTSYFWGERNAWQLLRSKKRAPLPSLEYGKGINDLANAWKERGIS